MDGRQPEDRHRGVADELLDDAAMALDDRLHALELAREQGAERLRVERLAESRRTGEVAEQHGYDLALLVRPSARAPHSGQNLKEPAASYPQTAQVATPEV